LELNQHNQIIPDKVVMVMVGVGVGVGVKVGKKACVLGKAVSTKNQGNVFPPQNTKITAELEHSNKVFF
jgi:hypothetical protein